MLTNPRNRAEVSQSHGDSCPACRQGVLNVFFEIEQAPILCNVLCSTREQALAVPRGAIRLGFCQSCGHVYNAAFDPALMRYDAAYENALQFSPRFRAYLESLARGLVERHRLRDKEIIEIGCGQGDFLSLLCSLGGNRGTGFDPSFDAAKADTTLAAGVNIVPHHFSHEHAGRAVDLLCCRHVLEHIPRPLDFLQGIRHTIGTRPDVLLFFEVPSALFTLDRLAIWDIIYEHCSYFTPASLRGVFELAGFEVLAVNDAYDGQFLTIEARPRAATASIQARTSSIDSLANSVRRFESAYRSKVTLWKQRLEQIAGEKSRAVIWGAGSKGVTFLNRMAVPPGIVPFAVDLNPRKQGQFIVGTGQAIVSPAFLVRAYRPNTVIVMNDIYRREIEEALRGLGIVADLISA